MRTKGLRWCDGTIKMTIEHREDTGEPRERSAWVIAATRKGNVVPVKIVDGGKERAYEVAEEHDHWWPLGKALVVD